VFVKDVRRPWMTFRPTAERMTEDGPLASKDERPTIRGNSCAGRRRG
jgi:hypothetical protein